MNRLSSEKRAQVVRALVEGNSIRATVRMTGVAKNTITKLLVELGEACSEFQDGELQGLTTKRIQCDEIWSFCYAKAKNVPADHKDEFGYCDVWTWTAIDADTKLCLSWQVGSRDLPDAEMFIHDVWSRLSNRVQLTTDGWHAYLDAVEGQFGSDIDYAQLTKLYGRDPRADQTKYSPAKCIGMETKVRQGNPDPKHISTSYVERQNLTMRMGMRRFTRLTNAFSKKVENLIAAVSLHFMYYNFARPHQTLTQKNKYPTTPAMAAGVTDHVWTIEEIVKLLETPAQKKVSRN